MEKTIAIINILDELEQELKALDLWHGKLGRPAESAFLSKTPFCLDTMEFHQWLEYVLIAKLREIIDLELDLPATMITHTMAQEYYRGQWERYKNLIKILRKLDSHFK